MGTVSLGDKPAQSVRQYCVNPTIGNWHIPIEERKSESLRHFGVNLYLPQP